MRRTIQGVKGGHQKIPSSFAVKASVIVQTAYQNAKNQRISDVQKDQISLGSKPSNPLLYYVI